MKSEFECCFGYFWQKCMSIHRDQVELMQPNFVRASTNATRKKNDNIFITFILVNKTQGVRANRLYQPQFSMVMFLMLFYSLD